MLPPGFGKKGGQVAFKNGARMPTSVWRAFERQRRADVGIRAPSTRPSRTRDEKAATAGTQSCPTFLRRGPPLFRFSASSGLVSSPSDMDLEFALEHSAQAEEFSPQPSRRSADAEHEPSRAYLAREPFPP